MKFRKKPVVIEAITFDELVAYGLAHCGVHQERGMPWSFNYETTGKDKDGKTIERSHPITHENDDCYLIPTLEGTHKMGRMDMLITGVAGEIYPCKIDIFKATYEPVESSTATGNEVPMDKETKAFYADPSQIKVLKLGDPELDEAMKSPEFYAAIEEAVKIENAKASTPATAGGEKP